MSDNVELFEFMKLFIKDTQAWVQELGMHAPQWAVYAFLGLASLLALEFIVFIGVLIYKCGRRHRCLEDEVKKDVMKRYEIVYVMRSSEEENAEVFEPRRIHGGIDIPTKRKQRIYYKETDSDDEYKILEEGYFRDDEGNMYSMDTRYNSLT